MAENVHLCTIPTVVKKYYVHSAANAFKRSSSNCKNMKRFGGPHRKKKRCMKRKCTSRLQQV